VPTVRFSRDKRGYEYVYLVHTPMRRGKPGRSRVLYWFRTPPGIRVGRTPFDEEMQRAIEQQYPGVTFDWNAIISTPMPPPDLTEFWRERRRVEKAARQERRTLEAEEAGPETAPDAEQQTVDDGLLQDVSPATTHAMGMIELSVDDHEPAGRDHDLGAEPPAAIADVASDVAGARKRRRRRGGRRRDGQGGQALSTLQTENAARDAGAEQSGDEQRPSEREDSAAEDE
jgi:hypothetical protein